MESPTEEKDIIMPPAVDDRPANIDDDNNGSNEGEAYYEQQQQQQLPQPQPSPSPSVNDDYANYSNFAISDSPLFATPNNDEYGTSNNASGSRLPASSAFPHLPINITPAAANHGDDEKVSHSKRSTSKGGTSTKKKKSKSSKSKSKSSSSSKSKSKKSKSSSSSSSPSSSGLIVTSGTTDDEESGSGSGGKNNDDNSNNSGNNNAELVDRARAIVSSYNDYLREVSRQYNADNNDNDDSDDDNDDDNDSTEGSEHDEEALLERGQDTIQEGNNSYSINEKYRNSNYYDFNSTYANADDSYEDPNNASSSNNNNNFQQFHEKDPHYQPTHKERAADFATSAYSTMKSKTQSMATKAALVVSHVKSRAAGGHHGDRHVHQQQFGIDRQDGHYNDYDFHNYQLDPAALAPPSASFEEEEERYDDLEKNLHHQQQHGNHTNHHHHHGLGLKERSGSKRKHHDDVDNNNEDSDYDNDYNEGNSLNNNNNKDKSFQNLCQDLGVTPATHPNLHKHFQFYSTPQDKVEKKRRKAILYFSILFLSALLIMAITSAATKGFEDLRRSKAPPLPDWKEEEERLNRQKWEWEEEHGISHEKDGLEKKPPVVMEEDAAEEAMPPPPLVMKSEWEWQEGKGVIHETDGVEKPSQEYDGSQSTTITETTEVPKPSQEDLDMIFESVSEAYRPIWYDRSTGWKGTTYAQSLLFCSSQNDYIPCPYEVYCPDNAKSLIGGIMENDGESWAAVINKENEWVQVGTGGECALYSELYGKAPEWGLSGVHDESITRHIMCCRKHPFLEGSSFNDPTESHVDDGAEGDDESEGISESESKDASYYATGAGDGNVDVGVELQKQDTGKEESGNEDASFFATGAGDGNADVVTTETQNSNTPTEAKDSSTPDQSTDNGTDSDSTTLTAWEYEIKNKHNPAWFSNELGWQGTTHADAKAFCNAIAPHGQNGDTMVLCPIQAYCPNGPVDSKPLYVQKDAFEGEQWAPIDSGDNAWVMVGMLNKDPSSTCRSYMELHHKDPTWGLDGSSTKLKQNILCCERGSSGVDSNNGGISLDNQESTSDITHDNVSNAGDSGTSHDDSSFWFDWNGGSREDAVILCNTKVHNGLQMELCPFSPIQTKQIICCTKDQEGAVVESLVSENIPSGITGSSVSEGESSDSGSSSNVAYGGTPADSSPGSDLFHPYWFDWHGGSHDDGIEFCEQKEGYNGKPMELCPFHAYCPDGPTKPVLGGHNHEGAEDEGEQWSPVFGRDNHWVLITMHSHNKATTCLSHEQLFNEMPEWGLNDSSPEKKKHIMCCTPLQ